MAKASHHTGQLTDWRSTRQRQRGSRTCLGNNRKVTRDRSRQCLGRVTTRHGIARENTTNTRYKHRRRSQTAYPAICDVSPGAINTERVWSSSAQRDTCLPEYVRTLHRTAGVERRGGELPSPLSGSAIADLAAWCAASVPDLAVRLPEVVGLKLQSNRAIGHRKVERGERTRRRKGGHDQME
eukprot:3266964-Rhodomonas_salina.2